MLGSGGVNRDANARDLLTAFSFKQFSTTVYSELFDFTRTATSAGNPPNLSVPSQPAGVPVNLVTASLAQPQLESVVAAAIARWSAAGLTSDQIAALHRLKFEVSDLTDEYLGTVAGDRILVDRDAGGKGWFVDGSRLSDSYFAHVVSTTRRYTDPFGAP